MESLCTLAAPRGTPREQADRPVVLRHVPLGVDGGKPASLSDGAAEDCSMDEPGGQVGGDGWYPGAFSDRNRPVRWRPALVARSSSWCKPLGEPNIVILPIPLAQRCSEPCGGAYFDFPCPR